jgi:hypothetical protein
MSMPEVRQAVPADVHQMAELHIAASRQAYTGLIPDHACAQSAKRSAHGAGQNPWLRLLR